MISVVLPAHNEAANLPRLLHSLTNILEERREGYELLVVDDGSSDETWAIIEHAAHVDSRVFGLRLSRNFGHQAALSAGLQAATGDIVITMDADLQHPPEVIVDLLEKCAEGFDVVYAVRTTRDAEGWFKRRSSHWFYRLLNRLTGLDLPVGAGDFRLMTRRVVQALLDMPERQRFLRGMARWVGYPQAVVAYERQARVGGASKYTLRSMVGFALDALTSFSATPLWLASLLGLGVSGLGAIYLVYVVVVGLTSKSSVSGWSSVLASVLILGGVQLACIGIMGQYLGRMFQELKQRPLFLVRETTAREDPTAGPRREVPQVNEIGAGHGNVD